MIAPASRKLGKYDIRQKLGRGGMADVYLAQDSETGHVVALKLIEYSPDIDTRESIEAERRGAELQARLAAVEPRVVPIYDAGDLDGYFYVAMEYVDGQDLSDLTRRGPLTVEFAVDTAIAVAKTLQSAHNLEVQIDGKNFHGIVHGDIKPKNIRIDARGEVRVLDFGIAKALTLTRKLTRNEFGSVPYSSPERLDAGQVNVQSDLWSLAVMLYEMVTGLQPYQADTTERLESMIRSRIAPPPAPDPCPEGLRRILLKSMAPEPELRYATAREFADDLEAFRGGGTVRAIADDLDATRRTVRRNGDETRRTFAAASDDDTRRTAPMAAAAAAAGADDPVTWPPVQAKRKLLDTKAKQAGAALLLGFVLYCSCVGIANYLTYKHSQQLAQQIDSEQLTDPNQIWEKWTELSQGNASSLLLRGARTAVKQKLTAEADRAIGSYRNGDVVYEPAWKNGRDQLARALTLDPDDSTRGKLRLIEGHIDRINGTAHKNGTELNEALAKFGEAQHLLPASPDPFLGMARTYVYGLKDIDKGSDALQEAQKRGYTLGSREKLQLADGYRDRADRLFWDSRTVRGLPQEKDQIARAKDDYERAEQLYQGIVPYGTSGAGLQSVQSSLESVNFRLRQIDNPDITNTSQGALGVVKKLLHLWR